MVVKTDSHSPENLVLRGELMRHGEQTTEASSRPSNLFLFGSASPSCRTVCTNAKARLPQRPTFVAIKWMRLLKNSDEHRWYVLQEVLRVGVLEQSRMLFQFVGHLIDDETATRRQRIVCFLQERTFLLNL